MFPTQIMSSSMKM